MFALKKGRKKPNLVPLLVTILLGQVVQSLISTNPGLTVNRTYTEVVMVINPRLALIALRTTRPCFSSTSLATVTTFAFAVHPTQKFSGA